jgi:hypothetical protein
MATFSVSGSRGTGNVESGQRKVDIREDILRLDPDAAPLTVVSGRLDSKPTENPEFKWFEDDRRTRRTTTTTTGTGTAITVGTGALGNEHDIWRNTQTGENVRIQSVSGNVWTVVRGASPVALTSGDEFLLVGSSQPEGDTSKPAISSNPTLSSNYTQIFRNTYEATRTWQQSGQYTRPDDWDHQARKAMLEHMLDKEAAFLWGVKRETTSGAHPRRETGGAYHFITTNLEDTGGATTETEFFASFPDLFRHGSKTKFGFGGRTAVSVITAYPRAKLEVIQADDDDTFGLSIMKYRTPLGTLNLVTHNLMSDSTTEYDKHVVVLDMVGDGQKLVRERYLTGGGYGDSTTHVNEHIEENNRDGRADEVLAEVGLEFGLEKAHGIYTDIAS